MSDTKQLDIAAARALIAIPRRTRIELLAFGAAAVSGWPAALDALEAAQKRSDYLHAELDAVREANAILRQDWGVERSHVAEFEAQRDCLAMFVRRLLIAMSANGLGEKQVCQQARKYIKAIGVEGSVLRAAIDAARREGSDGI